MFALTLFPRMNITDHSETYRKEGTWTASDPPQVTVRDIVISMKAGPIKYHIYKAVTQETLITSSVIFMNSPVSWAAKIHVVL